MQILACSRMLYQVRRKILPTIQEMRRKLTDTQIWGSRWLKNGGCNNNNLIGFFFLCFLFPQGIHMWFHIYNSSHFQKALLQWRGRSLNGWKPLFPNWVIKVLFQFVWSNSMPQQFSCVTGQKSSAKCLKTVGFLFLIATRNTWPSKHNHTTCPA